MPPSPVPSVLLERYDRPGPRYTSYPPVPAWTVPFGEADYRAALADLARDPSPVSVYVHLPFCVTRCFYCGCNATVTKRADVQAAYVDRLERELALVTGALGGRRRAVQLHWGGGTPNYLPPAQIERLARLLEDRFAFEPGAGRSIELDPRVGSADQLTRLRALGFDRISLGVQDFEPAVQHAIGREQPAERVAALTHAARALGFASLNFDLVYGLPAQTPETFRRTLEAVVALRPDRIACFGYAHVPWARPNQRRIDAGTLPPRAARFALFELAVRVLTDAGYTLIGLDHFAAPHAELAIAAAEGRLHRDFMGYTARPAPHLLAFGASGIGEVAGRYVQNDPKLGGYQRALDAGALPVVRGHRLTADDQRRRAAIMRLMCSLELPYEMLEAADADALERLRPLEADGLVRLEDDRIRVTPLGRFFLRNVCTTLDAGSAPAERPVFSRTI